MKKYIAVILALLLPVGCRNDDNSQNSKQSSYVNEAQLSNADKNLYALNGLESYSDIEISETEIQTEAVTESSPQFTEPTAPEYLTEEQKPNGLEFLIDIDAAKKLMSGYDIVSEEEKTNDSGELKTYIKYHNVELYGEIFELYLSFTNYKLTELSYQLECSKEESFDLYEEILDKIRDVYGKGARGDRVITEWGPNTLGENTEIYVFNNETSIAISFRLRDTFFDEIKREPFVTAEGLEFFMDIDTAKDLMSDYDIISETEKANCKPNEQTTVIEYENVELYGESFNLSLNFKNQRLIRLNYNMACSAEEVSQKYEEMIDKVKEIYGKYYKSDNDITMWNNKPNGKDSYIYIFNKNDSIKISFDLNDHIIGGINVNCFAGSSGCNNNLRTYQQSFK